MNHETMNEKLNQVLSNLHYNLDVQAVVVARRDGVVITSNLPRNVNPQKIAAMAASIIGISEMAVEELNQGGFKEVVVQSEGGKVLGLVAGEQAVIVALVGRDVNVSNVLANLESSASQIRSILEYNKPEHLLPDALEVENR